MRKYNFDTIFFSPHIKEDPFTDMLEMLGFDTIFTAQKICNDILKTDKYFKDLTLQDKGLFKALTDYLKLNQNNNQSKFICLYNIGTHAFRDVIDHKYANGDNQVLNRVHALDYEIGKFLDYFYSSQWCRNTYLIITTDHSTYQEPAYRKLFEKEQTELFCDRIPLLIYSPFGNLPNTLDVKSRTSLDFAPTVLNLLQIKKVANSFMGKSLFDTSYQKVNVFSANANGFIIDEKLYKEQDCPKEYIEEAQSALDLVEIYHYYDLNNMLFCEEELNSNK